ncbi:MAG TPA: hypothetical protein DCW90_03765 [Lachnospiraceae bacterium]|nr:hypothetical protein [uncultured Lachnoclostridium sp.]HAU84640.1 hypothetical protein [Lachnospiraceae bacterium]
MNEKEYLNDEELMQLIRDVEEHEMIQAPFYMKHEILQRVRKENVVRSAHSAKIQFLTFSFKVALATAAAVAVLLLAPAQFREMPSVASKEQIQSETFSKKLENRSNLISKGLLDFSNKVIGKEEYKYETEKEK